jgi:hypothetical protein
MGVTYRVPSQASLSGKRTRPASWMSCRLLRSNPDKFGPNALHFKFVHFQFVRP